MAEQRVIGFDAVPLAGPISMKVSMTTTVRMEYQGRLQPMLSPSDAASQPTATTALTEATGGILIPHLAIMTCGATRMGPRGRASL